jgi:hypothetical protein
MNLKRWSIKHFCYPKYHKMSHKQQEMQSRSVLYGSRTTPVQYPIFKLQSWSEFGPKRLNRQKTPEKPGVFWQFFLRLPKNTRFFWCFLAVFFLGCQKTPSFDSCYSVNKCGGNGWKNTTWRQSIGNHTGINFVFYYYPLKRFG